MGIYCENKTAKIKETADIYAMSDFHGLHP